MAFLDSEGLGFLSDPGDVFGGRASAKAGEQAAAASAAAIAEQRRQFDLNRSDLLPFLESATGTPTFGVNPEIAELERQIAELEANPQLGGFAGSFQLQELRNKLANTEREIQTGTSDGALQKFISGIDQAPGTPTIDPFTGQAVAAPTLDQFGGQAVQAPGLEQFSFDVQQALDSPELAFQREFGQQQVDRAAAANRQLGSGQRLLEAQRFGQGLASQSLADQFTRQLSTNQQRNALLNQQFGLDTQSLGQGITLNQLQNQTLTDQQGLDRQNLADRLNLSNVNQNRLLTQFGLENNAFTDRMNRLGGLVDIGRGTGGTLGQLGTQQANTIGGLQQDIGNAQAAATLGQSQARNNMAKTGLTALGFAIGGPAGGAVAGGIGGVAGNSNFQQPQTTNTNIGFQPQAQGFF